jgi:hypothetical protein
MNVSSNGVLFTLVIKLKENLLSPFTISLTGNSSLGDSSITYNLSNGGMNGASLEIPAGTEEVFNGVAGAVTYSYANGVLTLYGSGTMSDYAQGEAPWYKDAQRIGCLNRIKKIEFKEDHLQNIGKNAFYGFDYAETVSLSPEIVTINESAFEGCKKLKNIEIPTNSGVGIGNYAFKDCSALTSVSVPSGKGDRSRRV